MAMRRVAGVSWRVRAAAEAAAAVSGRAGGNGGVGLGGSVLLARSVRSSGLLVVRPQSLCCCAVQSFSTQAAPVDETVAEEEAPRPRLNLRKQFLKQKLEEVLVKSSFAGIVRHKGLSAAEWAQLRYDLRQKNLGITIVPNGVVRKHLEQEGLPDALGDKFQGQTAIVYSKDDLPFGALKDLGGNQKLNVVAAYADSRVLGVKEVETYANIPDLDTLRGQLITVMQQPMMVLRQVLTSNQSRLVYALGQVASPQDKDDAGDDSTA